MLEIKGKYCKDCKIFAETIEEEALSTVYGICDHPAFKDSKIRIMSDVHQGKGIVIGFTCPVGEYVNPAHVGCVDCDTEILTKRGWIKISDYNFSFGEILQFDPITETASFIKPIKYIKQKQDKFYWFKNSKGLNQMVSSYHNILVYYGQSYRNSTNLKYIKVKPNFFDDKKSLEKGYYRFKAAFDKDDETDLNIPDDWIRIDIMVQADGYIHINKNGTVRAHLHLKKHRKIERAKLLLNNANVEFKEHYNNKNDSYTISFNVPLYIGKDLHKYFSANRHQLEIIAEECLYWDGHRGYRSFYSSTDKNSIDLIQYAFTATNTRASISKTKMYNKNYSQGYTVIPTKNNYVGYTCKPIIVNSKDGFEYCFSTTTGCFVCRREGHVFITGNCDVGCSMTTIQLSKQIEEKDYPTFERRLRNKIPTGFEIQSKVIYPEKDLYKFLEKEYRKARSSWSEMIPAIDRVDERFITKLCQRVGIEERLFYKSIGTIGGGNHFLEYGETDDSRAFLTVHCGSRNFGLKVAKYWMSQAKRGDLSKELDKRIKEIKETVHDKTKWESLIKKAKEEVKQHNPEGYLEGEKLQGYLSDMVIAQGYAKYNHEIIMNLAKEILLGYGIHEISRIQTIHNYISFEDHIIRKGAIQSYSGRKMIIPFNMRDDLAICEGKSNQDWNFSAPHRAGRVMSRSAARENVDLEEFKETMKGIYSTCIGRGTLDESPMVYKDTSEIINAISDTAEILFFVKPRINIKAKDTTED